MTEDRAIPAATPSSHLTTSERRALELGRRRYAQGDSDGALGAYRELLRTRGGFADVHYRVATLLEERGDLEAASQHLHQALHLNPSYIEALLALGSLYERQGDFERARGLADRASALARPARGKLDPTTRAKLANMQAEMADAYREAGELRDAVAGYKKALDRCPHFHDIRFRLGMALREAGRPAAACAEFRRVIRANPAFRDASVQLGVTLYSLGRTAEAVEQWQAVREADPGREDAQMYLRIAGAAEA